MSNIGQSGIRLDYNGHFVIDESCQINKQNAYLLLAFLQSGSVPELDMHESKHFLPGPFVHSVCVLHKSFCKQITFDATKNTFLAVILNRVD
jgi:hypothetical protein